MLFLSRLVDITGAGAAQRPADSDPSYMLEEGPDGFEGGRSAKKYMTITGASKATATRDLQELMEKGIFAPTGSGRSTRYQISL
jgi:Fic family protein